MSAMQMLFHYDEAFRNPLNLNDLSEIGTERYFYIKRMLKYAASSQVTGSTYNVAFLGQVQIEVFASLRLPKNRTNFKFLQIQTSETLSFA